MTQDEWRPTADDPFVISNPSLGFVNLLGDAGSDLVAQDRATLDDIFHDNIHVAERRVPKCNVLFFYGALEPSGSVAGASFTFRDLVKDAGAHIGVIASELDPALLSNPEFGRGLAASNDWPATIVMTINRNGEHFGRFFHELFAQMQAGTSMPMAWVKLAPQAPQQRPDIPGTICLMEAGHIAFGPKKSWLRRLF